MSCSRVWVYVCLGVACFPAASGAVMPLMVLLQSFTTTTTAAGGDGVLVDATS